MIKKRRTSVGFLNALERHAETVLTDRQRVVIAKRKYLMTSKEEVLQAVAEGYAYAIIATTATEELLKSGVPASFSFTNKEGEEITRETKYVPGEIKKFCEGIEV